jgi:hypothetical protein
MSEKLSYKQHTSSKYSKMQGAIISKTEFLKVFHPFLYEPGTPPCGSLGQYIQVSLG